MSEEADATPAGTVPWGGPLATKGFMFSDAPMLLVDRDGRVSDVNIALQVLLGADVAGCKGHASDYLIGRLQPRLNGQLFPPDGVSRGTKASAERPGYGDLAVAASICRYESSLYGGADLEVVEVPCLDVATGRLIGSALNVRVMGLERLDDYRAAVRRQWSRAVMWEVYATSYDRILPEMPFYREVVARHLFALRSADAHHILDIGTGTGNVALPLLRDGRSVAAVDVSPPMLERFVSKLAPNDAVRLTLVEDTAESLPHFTDGQFDGVTALLAFFDMTDPHAALDEAVRLLRPGGTLIITDPKACFNVQNLVEHAERYFLESGLDKDLRDDWDRVRSVANALETTIKEKTPANDPSTSQRHWSAEHIFDILSQLGFLSLTTQDSHYGNCATIQGRKPLLE